MTLCRNELKFYIFLNRRNIFFLNSLQVCLNHFIYCGFDNYLDLYQGKYCKKNHCPCFVPTKPPPKNVIGTTKDRSCGESADVPTSVYIYIVYLPMLQKQLLLFGLLKGKICRRVRDEEGTIPSRQHCGSYRVFYHTDVDGTV